jgi:triosephosphate isomerase
MSPERTPLVAGNWKMNGTLAEARALVAALLPRVSGARADVAVCPPFTALRAVVEVVRDADFEGERRPALEVVRDASVAGERRTGVARERASVAVFAQNVHEQPAGAFTGEVSLPMLRELEVAGAIVGHSERRAHFGETDRALARKVPAILAAGLTPILCVGETEDERERGETERRLRNQVQEDLAGVAPAQVAEVVIAYEPIWAIGTGRVASAEQAQEAIAFIRALVADRAPDAGARVRILYGGSVSPGNAAELLALPDVDGALVGGASLDAEAFAAIVAAAG